MAMAVASRSTERSQFSLGKMLSIYVMETRCELLKVLRMPAYAIPTLAFPAIFYLLFGVVMGKASVAGSTNLASYLLATYGAFGVIGAALFNFGVSVAIERGQGWMLLKKASPMPIGAYFTAKMIVSLGFSLLVVAILQTLGVLLGGVDLGAGVLVTMTGILVLGAIPFCAMGLLIGYAAGPNSAPAIVNIIYLPMAFASGLWIPMTALPDFMERIARFLPAFHLGQLALKPLGADAGDPIWQHTLYLVVFTVVCLAGAGLAYRLDEDKTHG